MNIISLIQPSELGPDFRLDDGVWKVNFPSVTAPPPPISNDARNIIQNVTDGMYVDQRNRLAYAMVQDNQTQKIQLWQFPADEVFNINTATMVSEIDMLAMNGQFDDIAIDEGVVTFTDVQSGLTLTINTNELQRVGSIKSTDTVNVTENAGVLTFSAKLDPKANNLLEVTVGGLQVAPAKVEQIFDAELAKLDIHTQEIHPDADVGQFHVIGDQITTIPKLILANSAGETIALVNDPNAVERSSWFTYPNAVEIKNHIGGGEQLNRTTANFSLRINGVDYFTSKPDLFVEDLSILPAPGFFILPDSSGSFRFGVIGVGSQAEVKEFKVVLSPSTEQKAFSDKYIGLYRGARVLANGDLEFTLFPRVND